jgi:L-malate glycosyltransferase
MNDQQNKIHHILFVFPFFDEGGAPRRVILMAKILSQKGIKVTIAGRKGSLIKLIKNSKINYLEFGDTFTKGNVISQLLRYMSAILKTIIYLRNNSIDIISNHGRYTSIIALIVSRLFAIKYYSGAHGFYVGSKYLKQTLWGDKIFAVSDSTRDNLIQNYGIDSSRISVIKNTIEPADTKYVGSSQANSVHELEKIIICCAAMYVENKGHIFLLEAMEYILRRRSDIHLLLVGYGPLTESITDYIYDNNMSSHIKLLPSDTDVFDVIKQSHITVLPSLREGIPTFILESFCLGKPAIGFDVVGVNEIIKDQYNGLLVPAKKSELFGDAIVKVLDDKVLYNAMCKNAHRTYHEEFNFESYKQSIYKFYCE